MRAQRAPLRPTFSPARLCQVVYAGFSGGQGGGDWEDVAETIRIVRVPCRFGGSRAYFMCPGNGNGVECGRRVAKLHQLTRYFLCRHCNRLMYTSQSESQWELAIRRANQ